MDKLTALTHIFHLCKLKGFSPPCLPAGKVPLGEGLIEKSTQIRSRWVRAVIFLLVICSIFIIPAHAATYFDPSLKWKTLETLHFKINYYPQIEDKAIKMASIAEEVHSRLSPLFKHIPDLKTDIVLMDTTDYSNGFTSVIPNPVITLYMADIGSNQRPTSYDDWLRYVFTHEYTHLLHLDTVEGSFKLFKFLFGRDIFPNALSPKFIIEGLATYMETNYSKGGRGQDMRFLSMLRMDALDDNFKSIDQASVDTARWPMGNISYLYGVSFLEYLSQIYGEDKLFKLSQEYGDYFYAYGIDGAFQQVYGKSLWVLWRDWQEEVVDKSKAQKEKIIKSKLTKPQIITYKGYSLLKPKWGQDPESIYYIQSNQDDASQIRRINIKTKDDVKICDGIMIDDNLNIVNDTLYFSKGDIYNNFYYFKDIYSLETKTKNIKRLTTGFRASDPAVSKDGSKIVYTRNKNGNRTLWFSNIDGTGLLRLGATFEGVQYFSPQFSPDSTKLAVAKWSPGGQKINIIDIKTGAESPMTTQDLSLEANPCFTPNGKYILFDSELSGVPNIYAFEYASNKIFKVTNVLGMALMPDVSKDGKKIAYSNYTSRGFDIAVIDLDPRSWTEVSAKIKNKPVSLVSSQGSMDASDVIVNKYDYNPIPTLIPKFWYPYSYYNENGSHLLGSTVGLDALSQQYFTLQGGYDWRAKRSFYFFNYYNDQFLPQIRLILGDTAYAYSWDFASKLYWEREKYGALSMTFYDNSVFSYYDRQNFTLGYQAINLSNITSLEILTTKPSLGNLSGLFVGYSYSNLRAYGYSISPEEGFSLAVFFKSFSRTTGSDFNLINYLVSGTQYFKTAIPHNILGVSATGSLSYGDSFVQSGFNYKFLSLRGYPYNLISGTKSALGSVKYLFPVSYPESGFGYGYLFFDRLWMEMFFDSGGASLGALKDILWKRSCGAELNLQTINGWGMFPVVLKLGYAKGIDAGGEEQIYFNISL
ncbi:PD40 domain-containing protein [Candidatus Saganbacteria bacterium]|nr:PD40 domain-containing protein [Candidatus Saganbacteria bacterium]